MSFLLWRSYGLLLCLLFTANTLAAQHAAGPSEVVAEQTGLGEVSLRWTAVPGAREYLIQRSVWPNGFQALVRGGLTEAKYVDTTARPGVKHVYGIAAKFADGRATPWVRSNEVTPGGRTRPLEIRREAQIDGRSAPEPSVDVAVYDTLTPAPDTLSAKACVAEADRKRRVNRQALRRSGQDTVTTVEPEKQPRTPLQQAYLEGKCRYGSSPGYPELWVRTAEISGLPHDELVIGWRELNTIGLLYRHLLQREPTREEAAREVAALRRGKHWKALWRELAQSTERDQRFGFWAAAPLPSRSAAQTKFGLGFLPLPQICYGAMGPGCGGAPTPNVSPKWFGQFRLPDGSEFGYVSIGVGVGSVLHDNICLVDKGGLNCDGLGAGDLVKHAGWVGALEWNKATWNVLENRVWRDVFGPYPTSAAHQSDFFDDLRPRKARPAKMAAILGMVSATDKTIPYKGGETVRTLALKAPPGTWLDDTDAAFCASGRFEKILRIADKSPFGICGK